MADISDILKRAKPRERTVTVCLAGDVAGEVEQLESELARIQEDWEPTGLADANPAHEIARKLQSARERMRAEEAEFRFRALGDGPWSDLLAAHPPQNKEEAFDSSTFPPALIAACCIDPVMTAEQVTELFAVLNQGQIKELFDAAWDANNEATSIPFSLRASAILASLTDEK
jgi:hypothetical protein